MLPIMAILSVVIMSGCEKDEDPGVRPVVTSTTPVNKGVNIALNSKVTSTFNVEMDATTITNTNFTLQQGSTTVAGAASYSGTTALFTPTANLAPNTVYTATITTGAKSKAHTGMVKNYVWTFTSGLIADTVIPSVTLSNPEHNSTGTALNQAIAVTFSETMDKTTITASTFILKQGTKVISGDITFSGNTATFTPSSDLDPNKVYTLTITSGAKDLAGNALASNKVITFTTGDAADTSLPMVHSINPANNAMGVSRNKIIALTFSEKMNPLTINSSTFILKEGTNAVAGSVNYSGTTATFTPTELLDENTSYSATINTGAEDLAGNSLAADVVWEFTTGAATSLLAVVNLGTSGNYVILAQSAINNSSTSAITGDIALSPAATSYITGLTLTDATGFATSDQVTGKVFAADMADPTPINLTTAVGDMVAAYDDAAGRLTPDFLELGTGNIGGKTLLPGLYKWTTTVTLPTDVTISGRADDVWIFQISGDLSMSAAVKITLTGGAQAKNIFWQVAGQATLQTDTHFEGVILSKTGITFQTRGTINGRALAQTAVILDNNAVTKP